MERSDSQASKIVLIVLAAALVASIVLTIAYFMPKHRLLDKYSGLPVDFGDMIDQALDGSTLMFLISEYRVRNDGAYPSARYLTETMEPDHPLFFEKIYVMSDKDDPSKIVWPELRDLHIWPGYTCVHEPGGFFSSVQFRFTAEEINYDGLIEKTPGELALVMVSATGIVMRAPGTDYVYNCAQFKDGDDPSI